MVQRYFTEPYRFIPPYRSTLWARLGRRYVTRHLRKNMGVRVWDFQGEEHLVRSLRQGHGILLAANHCRWADPVVLGMLGVHVRKYFYYLVSYHLFKQSRLMGWWLNRIGGYSILREGADREAIRASAQVLARAERPLVIFPEGTWFRQNDRLGPLQEGLALIARQAARLKDRPVVIHPVAIKYWLLADPRAALGQRLSDLEARLGWQPQGQLELLPRIEKLGNALLATKEIEQLGQVQPGTLDERIDHLIQAVVGRLEKYHFGKAFDGWVLERVRRLRLRLVRCLAEADAGSPEAARARQALEQLLTCENLHGHSLHYLQERPSLERVVETVQRIEETVTDEVERVVAPVGACVAVGPALDVKDYPAERRGADQLVQAVAEAVQGLLDRMLALGPPPRWNCPPRSERAPARAEQPVVG